MQIDLNFNSEHLKSMAQAVRQVIGGYALGRQFHGNELHNDVADIYPQARTMYTDTIQRAMRRYCHSQYRTVDQNKSLYERV
ncbi:MAG: hypothetical protein LBB89_11185 [Treponema sp.]|jgi:hypothetical protein|nr:hypothetical protein [Treponema sp.]